MSDEIFLVTDDGQPTPVASAAFESESVLQELLAHCPDLLGGLREGTMVRRRWLFIAREFGVPDGEDAGNRWSLDHLFLDQDGVPTFVEVKRASDERARRTVVAQMLDYAANGVRFWSVAAIRKSFEQAAQSSGEEPTQRLSSAIGEGDPEEYWKRVETNLRDGRIRMVFVADEISPELKRIVEFLNEQMRSATMAAIEIRHYKTAGTRLLVPRVVGQTARAEDAKATSEGGPTITVEEWIERFGEKYPELRQIVSDLTQWFRGRDAEAGIPSGSKQPSIYIRAKSHGTWRYPFTISPSGNLSINLAWLQSEPKLAGVAERQEILDQLKAISGLSLSTQNVGGFPAIKLTQFKAPEILSGFEKVAECVIKKLKAQ